MNPVASRELLERFRRPRAAALFTGWVLVIGLLGYLVYQLARLVARESFGMGGDLIAGPTMGRLMFESLLLLLLTGVIMVVPGLVALTIVGERERLTLPLLQVSQLTASQVVRGKLVSSMAYVLLLVVAVAPIVALPNIFGGLTLSDVAAGLGMVLLTALTLGCLALWVSARARSARGAVAGAYAWAALLAFLTLGLMAAEILAFRPSPETFFPVGGRELYSVWLNPYVGLVSAVDEPIDENEAATQQRIFYPVDELLRLRSGLSPFISGAAPVEVRGEDEVVIVDRAVMGVADSAEQVELPPLQPRRGPVWVRTVIAYMLISALALLGAARRIRVPERSPLRLRRSRRAAS